MRIPALCVVAVLLSACSSIQSVDHAADSEDGLWYYMPRRDFVVTISVDATKVHKITLAESDVYPDAHERYLLRYVTNPVGKNTMKVGIKNNGLLTTAGAKNEGGLGEALKNLAATAGTFRALVSGPLSASRRKGKDASFPCPPGDSVYVVPAQYSSTGLCSGMYVTVLPLARNDVTDTKKDDPERPSSSKRAGAGIYYRQAQPYSVIVSGTYNVTKILFSPNASTTHFLPVTRTLFGTGNADLAFDDGMPTKYDLDTDGELIALLKLPADIIGAYFTAVGGMFDAFKKNSESEAAALQAQTKADLARIKYEACLAAIKADDTATVTKLGC